MTKFSLAQDQLFDSIATLLGVHFVKYHLNCLFRDQIKTSIFKTNFKLVMRELKEGQSVQLTDLFGHIVNC